MNAAAGTVLWWGRFDPEYSRNRVLRQAIRNLGWTIDEFRPIHSAIGDLEARLRQLPKPDFVWVPCFRQRDVAAAGRWAARLGVPLVFDPLISAYDKQVFERRLLKQGSRRAQRLLRREQALFNRADLLIADTSAHAAYFCAEFGVAKDRVMVIPVGAEEELFVQQDVRPNRNVVEALFYGTFIDLQGPQVIVEAAAKCRAENVVWTMLGAGPLLAECQELAKRLQLRNVRFESWVPYSELPERIGRADVLLGVFGVSRKASSVIPNKVYQALACGRPVITRESAAYPEDLCENLRTGLIHIAPGDPQQLAEAVSRLAGAEAMRRTGAADARRIYERYFSSTAIAESLNAVIQRLRS